MAKLSKEFTDKLAQAAESGAYSIDEVTDTVNFDDIIESVVQRIEERAEKQMPEIRSRCFRAVIEEMQFDLDLDADGKLVVEVSVGGAGEHKQTFPLEGWWSWDLEYWDYEDYDRIEAQLDAALKDLEQIKADNAERRKREDK